MPSAVTWKSVLEVVTPTNIAMLREARPDLVEDLNRPGFLIPTLTEAARLLDITFNEPEQKYLEDLPMLAQESIRATIAAAISFGAAIHLHYEPAYRWQVKVTPWSDGQTVNIDIGGPDVEYLPVHEEGPGA